MYCQTNIDENHEYLKLDNVKNKNQLVNRIDEEGLIDHDTLRTYHKRFYLIDLWTLLKRTITHTYLGNWKILFLQFILYQTLGVYLKSSLHRITNHRTGRLSRYRIQRYHKELQSDSGRSGQTNLF